MLVAKIERVEVDATPTQLASTRFHVWFEDGSRRYGFASFSPLEIAALQALLRGADTFAGDDAPMVA